MSRFSEPETFNLLKMPDYKLDRIGDKYRKQCNDEEQLVENGRVVSFHEFIIREVLHEKVKEVSLQLWMSIDTYIEYKGRPSL